MIFCAGGDPGGSRALLPILGELENSQLSYTVLNHGFLGKEACVGTNGKLCAIDDAQTKLTDSRCFLYSSSATDTVPLTLAREAKKIGIAVVHVLDNWTSYKRRLCTDGLEPLQVDIYAVMDDEARRCAIVDGVNPSCIRVTGHPGLSNLEADLNQFADLTSTMPPDRLLLAFINEPLVRVIGNDTSSPNHYGFTEEFVLRKFASALKASGYNVHVVIVPHPKDDHSELQALWQRVSGGVSGEVLCLPKGRAIIPMVSAVAGMASILLYEAWLAGRPVLSLQPNVKADSIRRFSRLPGVHYTDDEKNINTTVFSWLQKITHHQQVILHPDIKLHASSPASIVKVIRQLIEAKNLL